MEGFQEKGEPEAWDMALGTVRGYRWWNVYMYFILRGGTYDRYTLASTEFNREFWHSPWQPNYRRSFVGGMHGGVWSQSLVKPNSWHQAKCEANQAVQHLSSGIPSAPPSHPVPYPDCGCGYWAFWNGLNYADFNSTPFAKYDRDYGYTVSIPLAGVVEGAGRTIIGEKGFRAERVRVTDLAMAIDNPGLFEEEPSHWNIDFGNPAAQLSMYGGPYPIGPLLPFLCQRLGVDEMSIRNAFTEATEIALGNKFRWHDDVPDLHLNTEPDENYGGKKWE